MNTRLTILTLAILLGLVGGAAACGQAGPPRWEALAERLDLSEEQKQAIGAIHTAAETRDLGLRRQIDQARAQLKAAMLADAPKEQEVFALVDRIGDLRTELQKGRLQTRLAVRKELTPQQRDRLLAMEARRGDGPRPGRPGRGHAEGPRDGRGPGSRECPRD